MTPPNPPLPLAPEINRLLVGLRWRIRAYVLGEGLALALVWLGLMFWVGLALDYLPVLVGASEMPRGARAFILLIVAAVLAFILYHWVFRRTFARLANRSMAVLLERRFDGFEDSLVTSVEMSESPDHASEFNSEMLQDTNVEALGNVGHVRLAQVFNYRPLLTKLALALLLIVPVGILWAVNAEAVEIWLNRMVLLGNEPWPRNALIEVVGLEVQRQTASGDETPTVQALEFANQRVKVAKGSNLTVKVRSDVSARVVPDSCSIYYRSAEGDRGHVNMKRLGRPRDRYQMYSFDGKPFKGILSSLRFDVIGFDHRVRDFRIEVVDSPAVVEPVVEFEFPAYTGNAAGSQPLVNGMQFPRGTKLTIRARSNKPLARVYFSDVEQKEKKDVDLSGATEFSYTIERLMRNLTLDVTLHDTDNVIMEHPHRFLIVAVEDQVPKVNVVLRGISSVVTPDVLMPAKGKIEDDYGVAKSWFEVRVNDDEAREFPFPLDKLGTPDSTVDFRVQRGLTDGLKIKPKDKLIVMVKASDKFDLEGGPNIGAGDKYQLEVVTPDELLASLDRRELALRRRLEQIIEEMTDTRDSLLRVKQDTAEKSGVEPEDAAKAKKPEGAEPDDKPLDEKQVAERLRSLKLLRVQQAQVQSEKSAQEVLGIAAAFAEIREELVNNRVDTEEREKRIKDKISDPLQSVGTTLFPELTSKLKGLEGKLQKTEPSGPAADAAVRQANDILAELQDVLKEMLYLETYKELIAILRAITEDQGKMLKETEKLQTEDPFGLQ